MIDAKMSFLHPACTIALLALRSHEDHPWQKMTLSMEFWVAEISPLGVYLFVPSILSKRQVAEAETALAGVGLQCLTKEIDGRKMWEINQL